MRYFVLLLIVSLAGCTASEKQLSGKELLEKSIQHHDPKEQWNSSEFTLRIQEPRLRNPERFSLVYMNTKNGAFKLLRNRGEKIASYGVNDEGNITVLLDNKYVEDSLAIEKYMLQPTRVERYKEFYEMMLGLPMSLTEKTLAKIGTVSQTTFNEKSAFKVQVKLKKPMFSDTWNLFISEENFSLLGIEMIFPDDPEKGERLYFEKSIEIGDLTIPRVRHWYELNDTYSGSDVIVYEIK